MLVVYIRNYGLNFEKNNDQSCNVSVFILIRVLKHNRTLRQKKTHFFPAVENLMSGSFNDIYPLTFTASVESSNAPRKRGSSAWRRLSTSKWRSNDWKLIIRGSFKLYVRSVLFSNGLHLGKTSLRVDSLFWIIYSIIRQLASLADCIFP